VAVTQDDYYRCTRRRAPPLQNWIGAKKPETIALMTNTSHGVKSRRAHRCPIMEGARDLFDGTGEFPANIYRGSQRKARGAEFRLLPLKGDWPDEAENDAPDETIPRSRSFLLMGELWSERSIRKDGCRVPALAGSIF